MKSEAWIAIVAAVMGSGMAGSLLGWARERRKDAASVETTITEQAGHAVDVMSRSIGRLEQDLARISAELLQAKAEIKKLEALLAAYERGAGCAHCRTDHQTT